MVDKGLNMKKYLFTLAVMALASPAFATSYAPDLAKSQVGFSGTHAGSVFKGSFTKWSARMDVDPKNLAQSCIEATFDLSGAQTGNAMYDGTLPSVDWFDVKGHPQGRFVSTVIKPNKDGSYTAEGNLTLRGVTKPTHFTFTADGKTFATQGNLVVDRIAYGIGAKSDPKAEWVSKDINVTLNVTAPLAKDGVKASCK